MKKELLKTLKKRERSLQSEVNELGQQEQTVRKQRKEKQEELNNTKRRLKILNQDKPHISEHAVYRYMQRVQGVNTDEIREQMLTPQALDLLDKMGWADGTYPAGQGYSLVVKDGTIVTIYV